MVYSPLDQFKIAPLITIQFAGIDLSVSCQAPAKCYGGAIAATGVGKETLRHRCC